MDVITAADYYDIAELGGKCLDYIKKILDIQPNLVFAVIDKYGIDHTADPRKIVGSVIFYARS
mgnify:CR=1 FL=1